MYYFGIFFEKVKIYALTIFFTYNPPFFQKDPASCNIFFFVVVYLAHVVGNIIFPSAFIVVQFFARSDCSALNITFHLNIL